MKHSALHARFGTEAEFAAGNNVVPAGIFCVTRDETTGATTGLRIGDGVTEWENLPNFAPAAAAPVV